MRGEGLRIAAVGFSARIRWLIQEAIEFPVAEWFRYYGTSTTAIVHFVADRDGDDGCFIQRRSKFAGEENGLERNH